MRQPTARDQYLMPRLLYFIICQMYGRRLPRAYRV